MRARRYHQIWRPKVHLPYCSLLQFGLRAQLRTGRVVFKWPYLIPVKKKNNRICSYLVPLKWPKVITVSKFKAHSPTLQTCSQETKYRYPHNSSRYCHHKKFLKIGGPWGPWGPRFTAPLHSVQLMQLHLSFSMIRRGKAMDHPIPEEASKLGRMDRMVNGGFNSGT